MPESSFVCPFNGNEVKSPLSEDPIVFSFDKSDVLWVSFILINALTILDLVLSRRTKPWRFFLRILYRISRSNIKWATACLFYYIWFQCGGGRLTDPVGERIVQHLPLIFTVACQMQQAWLALQSYPILSTLSFAVYNLMTGWILHPLMPRNDIRRDTPQRQRTSSASIDGLNNSIQQQDSRARVQQQSRWSLLVECLFRPVSFATAHNLTDFDFELDDSMELLIERLALPNLWLTPVVPTDYLKYLPVWHFNGWECDAPIESSSSSVSTSGSFSSSQTTPSSCNADRPPSCMIPSSECAICLDKYRCSIQLCGLPCGHHFHHGCISTWLQSDNHHCPICRWPAYRNKCLSSI